MTRISIEKLRIRFPQYNFFQQDISAPLKSNDRFNFINIFDVLWYLDDADFEKAFNNLAKLSQKGSFLFITDIFTKDKYNQSEGFWARSIPIYEFYCKRCGFEIVKIYPLFVFTNTPCDPDSVNKWFFRFLSIHWRLVSGMLRKYNFLGNLLGFSLFMFDYIIVQFIKNGPSAKLMVLKKI